MSIARSLSEAPAAPPRPAADSRPREALAAGRDLRIDLLRGLALWMIFVDHIPRNILRLVTYHRIGYSDAAEIFVFLSGVSCSLAYGRLLTRNGFPAAQRRALGRVLQIYLGYLVVAILTFTLVLSCRDALGAEYLAANDLDLLLAAPVRSFLAAGILYYTPQYLDILPLYMVFVALAPVLICGLRRFPRLTLGASAALWIATALEPHLRIPNLVSGSFNPLSWQFLFCIGLWVGGHFYGVEPFRAVRGIVVISAFLIAANLLARIVYDFGRGPGHFHLALLDEFRAASNGGNEGFPRLTHFLAVAYIFAAYGWRRDAGALRQSWARPLVWCGQHSLEVFCVGVVLGDVIAVYFLKMQPNVAGQLLANAFGLVAMVVLAWSLGVREQGKAAVSLARRGSREPTPPF